MVQSPDNPGYHWGNFVLITSTDVARHPDRCIALFERHFPQSEHLAIGLPARPSSAGWEPYEVELEMDEVLVRTAAPASTGLAGGYDVHELTSEEDWARHLASHDDDRPDGVAAADYERFVQRTVETRRRLVDHGHAAFFGAFHGGDLVADLGIVLCPGGLARYQSVRTVAEHRRRGLASHLLAVAGGWAALRGARRWVILAESHGDAERLYRSRGFESDGCASHQIYRGQPLSGADAVPGRG